MLLCFFHFFPQSISIPLGKGNLGDANTAKFQLDCSVLHSRGQQQGGMDCVQQSGGSNDIRTVGPVTHKINVKATDDSYQMTQQRMKEVEEERKGVRYEETEQEICTNQTFLLQMLLGLVLVPASYMSWNFGTLLSQGYTCKWYRWTKC